MLEKGEEIWDFLESQQDVLGPLTDRVASFVEEGRSDQLYCFFRAIHDIVAMANRRMHEHLQELMNAENIH